MCERKKGVQNDPKSFCSSHCKDGVEMRKAVVEQVCGGSQGTV